MEGELGIGEWPRPELRVFFFFFFFVLGFFLVGIMRRVRVIFYTRDG